MRICWGQSLSCTNFCLTSLCLPLPKTMFFFYLMVAHKEQTYKGGADNARRPLCPKQPNPSSPQPTIGNQDVRFVSGPPGTGVVLTLYCPSSSLKAVTADALLTPGTITAPPCCTPPPFPSPFAPSSPSSPLFPSLAS